MADTIKILVFDEDDSLLDAISQGKSYPVGLALRKVTHINDLILALDDYEPHIVVVNERLSSYESLSVLAIAKKRGQEFPYMVFYDDTFKIRSVKRRPSSGNLPDFNEIIPVIENVLMDMSRKEQNMGPFSGTPFRDAFERFSVFSDYSFLLSQERIILLYKRKPTAYAPDSEEEFRSSHFEDVLSVFFEKKNLLRLQIELFTKESFALDLWNGKEERKAFFSVRGITLTDGLKYIGLTDLTPLKASADSSLSQNLLLESIPIGIILLDFDEQITFINRYAGDIFSPDGQSLVGKIFDEAIPIKFTDTSLLQMKRLLYEDGSWRGKVFYRDKTHAKRELLLRAYLQRSEADQVTGILLLFDVQSSEGAAYGGNTDFRSIVEQIPQGIFIIEGGKLVYVTDLFCKMIGFVEPEQLIGKDILNLVEDGDIAVFSEAIDQIKNYDELNRELEICFNHKNGINRIYAQVSLNLMQSSAAHSIIGTARDITEKKLMEDAKPFLTENEFSSTSPARGPEHDLRTYLNAIIGFADILKEQSKDFADQSMAIYTEHIFASSQKLVQLMEQTAVLADTSSVPPGQKRESLNATTLADDVLFNFKEKAREKNLKLTVTTNAEVFVIADRRMLVDALERIIQNSIQSSLGGAVLVDCGYDTIKHNVFIRIKDNRPVIPEYLLQGIFDPIIDSTGLLTDELRDTNITFAVVRRILESMNGKIEVQSSPATGTAIYIQMPMDEEKTNIAAAGANVYYTISPDVIYLNELRPYILIIEDDPGSSKMLEITLRNVAKLEIVASGDDALDIIGQKYEQGIIFDIILVDIGLPAPWNGISLSQHIKTVFSGYQSISFIAETAFALRNDREKILASGFAGFLPKPIDRRYLIKTIASVIRKKRGDEEPKYENYTEA